MAENKNQRINFSSTKTNFSYPDFLEIQIKSFQDFFQLDSTAEERKKEGLYKVFQEAFPITDTKNMYLLEFLDYSIEHPRYSIEQCIERGLTYCVPLKVRLRLSCTDTEHEEFETTIQEVWFGQIPYMTPSGTFVFNGAERIIVSQLHRSPGVFFSKTVSPNNINTKLYSARIIPFKGSWIEFVTDTNNILYAYIDRKKKVPITILLRAIGFENDKDILEIFDLAEEVKVTKTGFKKCIGKKLAARVVQIKYEEFVDEDCAEVNLVPRHEIIVDRDVIIEESHYEKISDAGIKTILLYKENTETENTDYSIIFNSLEIDTCNTQKDAFIYIYRQLRGIEPPDEATARELLNNMLFSDKRYDLGDVGRFKLNNKLGLNIPETEKVLTKEDIIAIIKYLVDLFNSKVEEDDIDHLSNRRVRTVGEQLANLFSVGFSRMSRTIKDRMNIRDNEMFKPADLINAKTLASVLNTFFGTNQLSQFMDQINPLAEITHKRRLSALGPGGLSRERAGFEVRDVHYTHYGRLCPIETPEGPNIGLISSLCVYAKINSLGFIETPYRKVNDRLVNFNDISYYGAEEEESNKIVQANAKVDENGTFLSNKVKARDKGDFIVTAPENIHLMDIAPNQIASIAASLIPFLEHDDANRALMGSNMMRQAVPLLRPEAPIVGTGIEAAVAQDSRNLLLAEGSGIVEYVDAKTIKIRYNRKEEENFVSFTDNLKIYNIPKFRKTNQNTCVNLRPIVRKGDKVVKGTILTDGYGTSNGELALGKNLKVAFMPWKGYNFEDAIVLNEKVVKEDTFTSIHISDYQLEIRETKRGMEELTSDIPNVSENATKDLDRNGIIRIGAHIKPGDIMIGKITPKGETDPSPEEKLLRAIFGDKATDTKDASLKASPSINGVVIDTKLFSKAIKDKKTKNQDAQLIEQVEEDFNKKNEALCVILRDKLFVLLNGRISQGIKDIYDNIIIPKGTKLTQKILGDIDYTIVNPYNWTTNSEKNETIVKIIFNFIIEYKKLDAELRRKKNAILVGDELPNGIIQMAKVYLASKRCIKVGDKLAGRHGNKGILAKIVRQEDMPFLEDGSPVDIVLNPLGVPSRMNLGQIYETVLGWAGQVLGCTFATPIFDGASIEEINNYTDKAGIPKFGQVYLYDGGTGERFDQPATVGVIYMLKLGHMVEDKMHARSIGPYSLITQQPLGGKAQFGGQRFGEMEVWALEAFGAANILQEILTIKSDDVVGRAKTYESIVKGDPEVERGLPESFNVLLYELRGLCLRIDLE